MWLFISVTVSEVFSLNMLLAAQYHHIVDKYFTLILFKRTALNYTHKT